VIRAALLAMLCGWALVPVAAWAPPMEAIVLSGEERQALVDKLEELIAANQGLAKAYLNCKTTRSL
jgi:hypothetical protein